MASAALHLTLYIPQALLASRPENPYPLSSSFSHPTSGPNRFGNPRRMDIPSDSDSDYDLVSNPDPDHQVRDESFSVADLSNSVTYGHVPVGPVLEPPPLNGAKEKFDTVDLSRTDIQSYVASALNSSTPGGILSDVITAEGRTVRVYVDGLFDGWNIGHALQLRQAKLSFPSVHLMVGVFSDELCHTNGATPQTSHTERCEVIRHCRWVDEVLADAPWVVTEAFVMNRRIDYIAVEVGASVDPGYDKLRVYGYDAMKRQGRVIPIRRTFGFALPSQKLALSPVSPVCRSPIVSVEDDKAVLHVTW